jgi:hypothetical protein
MSTPSTTSNISTSADGTDNATEAQRPRRWGTFAHAAREQGVSERSVRNYLAKGYFPAYRMRGIKGVLLDLDEIEAAMRKLPSRLAKAGVGAYGPKAVILEIPPQVIIVNDGLGENR